MTTAASTTPTRILLLSTSDTDLLGARASMTGEASSAAYGSNGESPPPTEG